MTNPVFKTFYNHRIFVVYQPDAYRQYLLGIVEQKYWPKEKQFGLTLGLMAWGTILVYQSRMVASDFNRRLKALLDADGAFLYQNPSLPLSRAIYRQQLAMQLGIEVIAREPEVKDRIEETPIVAQYVYDTLYMPSFYHERGRGKAQVDEKLVKFTVTREDLREHLWLRSGRRRIDKQAKDADSQKEYKDFIAPETLDYLFEEVLLKYFRLLDRPKEIREKTRQYASELRSPERQLWLALAESVDESRQLAEYSFERRPQTLPPVPDRGASRND